MEEIKQLIELVREMPEYIIWILAGYLFYKLFILGSIYGVIRLAIVKLHDWLTMTKPEHVDLQFYWKNIYIHDEYRLRLILNKVANHSKYEGRSDHTDFHVHTSDLVWLQKVVDEALRSETKPNLNQQDC